MADSNVGGHGPTPENPNDNAAGWTHDAQGNWVQPGKYPDGGVGPGGVVTGSHFDAAPPAAGKPGAVLGPGQTPIGPELTLGPDGNVYGYSRGYDAQTGGYVYTYKNFGAATDPNAVATASGLPVGMVQQAVEQQKVTLSTLAAQGAINPYGSGMTQQQLSQALDAVRTAQQYQTAQTQQQIDPASGMTYAQAQASYDARNASFNLANLGTSQQAALYGYQRANAEGRNYNTNSPLGATYGQLGLVNANQQAVEQYASGVNYNAANPYSGLSNGQTGLAASNAGSALSLQRDAYALTPSAYSGGLNRTAYGQQAADRQDAYNSTQSAYNLANQGSENKLRDLTRQYDTANQQYNLGTASYTGGQTRQAYSQGTQDLQNQYNRADEGFKVTNQPAQQAVDTYQLARQTQQAQTQGQARNTVGLGYAGLGRPQLSGWQ